MAITLPHETHIHMHINKQHFFSKSNMCRRMNFLVYIFMTFFYKTPRLNFFKLSAFNFKNVHLYYLLIPMKFSYLKLI